MEISSALSSAQLAVLSSVEASSSQMKAEEQSIASGQAADLSFMGIGQNIDVQA